MAHRAESHLDRITEDPEIMVGKPVVKGTRIPVERVLAHLVDHPDLADVFDAYPELTREDVQAVLAYAHAKVAASPNFQSPQDFCREAIQREDIRRILLELACALLWYRRQHRLTHQP
jgi:uncharacterized protein (DUF433 family)